MKEPFDFLNTVRILKHHVKIIVMTLIGNIYKRVLECGVINKGNINKSNFRSKEIYK